MKHLLVLVMMLGLWCGTAQATTYWNESFEYADTAALLSSGSWINSPCSAAVATGIMEISTDRAFSGTKSLKFTYIGLNPVQTCWIDRFHTRTPELYTRRYVYLQGFTATSPPSKQLFTGENAYVNFWDVFEGANNTQRMNLQGTTLPASQANPTFGVVPSNQWVCLETHTKKNTPGLSDGVLEAWIDGTLRFSNTAQFFDASTQSSQHSFVRLYRQHGNGVIYLDSLAVGDTRIGCLGGTPSPSDTVAPSVPANLAVNGNVVTWTASTDGGTPTSGVASYDVYRCGPTPCTTTTAIANRLVNNFTDTTQVPGQSYAYAVRANDNASNSSAQSAQVTLTLAPTTFKNTLFADSFTRADNADIGANHDAGYLTPNKTNATLISNEIRGTATNTEDPKSYETVNSVSPPAAQWCQFTFGAFSGTDDRRAGCLVRAANPTTISGYWCYARKTATNSPVHNSAIQTLHSGGTGDALIATDSTTVWAAGDTGRCEAEGTAIRFIRIPAGQSVNLTIATATNAEFSSGRCGINMWMNTGGNLANSTITDFSCGGFSSSTVSAITVDAVSNSATTNTTNTISWTHATGSCDNRALVVITHARDDASAADTVVSGVTLAGTPMTKIRADLRTDAGVNIGQELWYTVAPPSGTSTIQITWAGALSRVGVGSSISLCGVNQVTPLDANAGTTNISGTTVSSVITTVTDGSAIIDAYISRPGSTVLTVGAGQTQQVNRTVGATMEVGASLVLNKTPAGAETMDWTRASGTTWAHSTASFKPASTTPVTPPTIASMVADATGMTVTYGATTPTRIRISRGDNGGAVVYNTFHDISEFPAGRYTKAGGWESGMNYICAHPIDAAGFENTSGYVCGNNASGPSAGFSPAVRRTAAVLSGALPNTVLPFGTTSRTISFSTDVQAECRYDLVDQPYDSMANTMTVNSLAASAVVTGLTNNSITLYYGRCRFINDLLETYDNTTSIVITVQVAAAAGDITLPSTVTNLACTVNGQCVWTAATDNVAIRGYRISLSTDACATFSFVASPTTASYNFPVLTPNTAYCTVVRAEDTTGNLSAADSNQALFTTPAAPDVTPPSTMANLRICDVAASLSLLCFDRPTDEGIISTIIQGCYGATCSNFAIVAQATNGLTSITVPIVPGIPNRFVGYFSDGTNRSVGDSNILEFTPQVGATISGVCNCKNRNNAN